MLEYCPDCKENRLVVETRYSQLRDENGEKMTAYRFDCGHSVMV